MHVYLSTSDIKTIKVKIKQKENGDKKKTKSMINRKYIICFK